MIYNLNSNSSSVDLGGIGEKAFNLMVLNEIGVNVPKGIVLSSKFKTQFEESNAICLEQLKSELSGLKSKFVMVRSSAIGEDGDEHSFAGQLESFQVSNEFEAIKHGIFKCWESIENDRVKTYQIKSKQYLNKMGVIIQEMIEPDYAGVFFTHAPDDSKQSLIEFVEGHCEKLVQGEITPETVYSGNDSYKYPFSITDFMSRTKIIEEHYKRPQDIEWLVKNDEFFFVQSRPITTSRQRVQWSSTNVNENYPNALSPLLYGIARRSYYFYFKNLAIKLGVLSEGEGESYLNNVIGVWGERMYYNMSHVHSILGLSPLKALLTKSFDDFVGYQKAPSNLDKTYERIKILSFGVKTFYFYLKLDGLVEKIEQRVSLFTNSEYKNELSTGFHEFLDIRFNYWFHASFADFYAMIFHGSLGKFLKFLSFDKASGLQNSLIQSIPGLISNQPIFELWEIKNSIKNDGYLDKFKEESASDLWTQLQTNPNLKNIKTRVDGYLKEWGFRCSGELCFLGENYIENPISFIQMLKTYISADSQNPKKQFDLKHAEQNSINKQALADISTRFNVVKSFIYSFILKFLVKGTVKGISSRERVRLKQAHMYFHFKQICKEIGTSLSNRNIINECEDVFFLEHEEISRILGNEQQNPQYLKSLIGLRKEKMNDATECPENLYNFEGEYSTAFVNLDLTQEDSLMKGLPACGGKIKARAVVLESIHEIEQLRKGDILITKQTDPGWICAFPIIGGLVVERGGMLSHGAIVAREFGIPAVVGVKNITQMIKTGDIIEVDGDNGVINV